MGIDPDTENILKTWHSDFTRELKESILGYWIDKTTDKKNGGYYGLIDNGDIVKEDAPKGLVMHARFLWSYSAAYRMYKDKTYLDAADKALDFLNSKMKDPKHGGFYWMCSADGTPTVTRKQVYGQAFVIYGLSEYVRAGGGSEPESEPQPKAEAEAMIIFDLLEQYARDKEYGGYFETLNEDWSMPEGGKGNLGDDDPDCVKSMNTNLHVLEAYTNLYRINKNERVEEALKNLIITTFEHIIDSKNNHLQLFFDADWKSTKEIISFGHDIEATWLLWEAISVLDNKVLKDKYYSQIIDMVDAVIKEGLDKNGGLNNETEGSHTDDDKHWWPQAEMMIGLLNAWEMTQKTEYLDLIPGVWNFIKSDIKSDSGEWYWGRKADGELMSEIKGGVWKTPYHNSRFCMEFIERIEHILGKK